MKTQAGLRLRAAREHLDLTQRALAHALGVERTAYVNWEKGERMPDVAAMVRLYIRTGITLEWIFAGSLREMSYDLGAGLEANAGRLGAVIGGPVAEWPAAVERLEQSTRSAAAVPKTPHGRTLHAPRSDFDDVSG